MGKFHRCAIYQISRDENARADALSKLRTMVEGIKERKITVMIREASVIDEKVVYVVDEASSCRIPFIQYLKEGKLPDDPITERRLQFKANRFTMLGEELYKRTAEGILLKCLDGERAQYVMREIHERSCGNHSEVEYFSKWMEAEPLVKISEKEVINIILKNIICRFEIPRVLVSDNGTQFQRRKIVEWCKELKIKQNFTTIGNPQANGQVEATNMILLQHLKTRLEGAKGSWVEELLSVLGL
ncbi:uncharacterized protein LOC105160181 [Sesamum indicum]|uniref:Uncharacterized protein LOC105160181 n=1 Tax=Sesamum indicum TaxID=4182 RepID=A0A6I9T5R9_SESIN|nr:uncharacterized protein LOC105160181 [Sesamum indicum]